MLKSLTGRIRAAVNPAMPTFSHAPKHRYCTIAQYDVML